jgi:hypothetical protein
VTAVTTEAPSAPPPLLAPLVRTYRRLAFVLVVTGCAAGVAVKLRYTPDTLDIAVPLVTGAPAGIISYVRVRRQMRTAGPPPVPARIESGAAMLRRFASRVGQLTLFLVVVLVALPLILGASNHAVGNSAAFGAGLLLSNG